MRHVAVDAKDGSPAGGGDGFVIHVHIEGRREDGSGSR